MKKISPLNVFIIILVIFNSGGVSIFGHYYITLLSIFLIFIKLVILKRLDITKILSLIVFFGIILAFNYIFAAKFNGLSDYIVYLSYFLNAGLLLLLYAGSMESFLPELFAALLLFLGHSILNYLFQIGFPNCFENYSDRLKDLYGVFYYGRREVFYHLIRNQGIFWEPGILQFYMNILLYLALFYYEKYAVAIISLLVILTTVSTTGYLITFLILMSFFYNKLRRNLFIAPVILMVVPVLIFATYWNLNNKLTGNTSKSANVRILDAVVGVSMFLQHPMVGASISQEVYKKKYYSYGVGKREEYRLSEEELEGKGTTNSVLFILSGLGLPIFLIICYFVLTQSIFGRHKKILFIILFLTALSEPIINTAFISIFIISGFFEFHTRLKGAKNGEAAFV